MDKVTYINGIKVIHVEPKTPLEQILSIGDQIKSREFMDKVYWKRKATKEEKRKTREAVEKFQREMDAYLKSKQNENDKTN